ncbi:Oligopeptide-binding protein AppA [invertebrate metagenome]|uniref:Oligopeptide-binding protein AppA n=1 Tax=invertebrate metagenome TaxID=1711999 RepID=A0A2H9TC48_9ZZZZ
MPAYTAKVKGILNNLLPVLLLVFLSSAVVSAPPPNNQTIIHTTRLSLVGESSYSPDFSHFRYANPNAPKGGTLKLASIGTFDTFNPYNGKGRIADGLFALYNNLMIRSYDEPYSLYPLIASSIEYSRDYAWVAFNLNPKARFHDGMPITADDVVYTLSLLKEKGSPFIQGNYKTIEKTVAETPHRVVFHLAEERGIKTLAFLGYLPVLPRHFWEKHDFSTTLTTIPIGSGPVRIKSFKQGQSIVYERVKDYWAQELPVNKGLHNFDEVQISYFRDSHASLEAFRAGLYDFRYEYDPKNWHHGYHFPAVKKGQVICESLPFHFPPGMSAFVFNTRKPLFQNRQVRQAIAGMLNFPWINQMLLYSGYKRTQSFFTNTGLVATGLPTDAEKQLLRPFKNYLPSDVFTDPLTYQATPTYSLREQQQTAIRLLKEAGWELRKGKMTHLKTGKPMTFTIIIELPRAERVVMPFKKNLASIGITMQVQIIDQSHYRKRVKSFDFDMADWHFWHSEFLGAEQKNNWHSQAASTPQSNNIIGIDNPAIDRLTELLSTASEYGASVVPAQALDRVLRQGYYVIPKWYSPTTNIAYWNHLVRPTTGTPWFPIVNAWWHRDSEENKPATTFLTQ